MIFPTGRRFQVTKSIHAHDTKLANLATPSSRTRKLDAHLATWPKAGLRPKAESKRRLVSSELRKFLHAKGMLINPMAMAVMQAVSHVLVLAHTRADPRGALALVGNFFARVALCALARAARPEYRNSRRTSTEHRGDRGTTHAARR
jgi:hypothetical protein